MKNIGRLEKFPELEAIVDAIFSRKLHFTTPNGTRLRTRLFKGVLFAVDYNGRRYVEQNPKTNSIYAERARSGAHILWVIKTHEKAIDATGKEYFVPCKNQWLGRVEDGIVHMK